MVIQNYIFKNMVNFFIKLGNGLGKLFIVLGFVIFVKEKVQYIIFKFFYSYSLRVYINFTINFQVVGEQLGKCL